MRADLYAVLENLDQGYLHFDAETKVQLANAASEAFLVCSRADVVGRFAWEITPRPLGEILVEKIRCVLLSRQGESFAAETFDGRRIVARVFPMSEGVAALFRDATVRQEQFERIMG